MRAAFLITTCLFLTACSDPGAPAGGAEPKTAAGAGALEPAGEPGREAWALGGMAVTANPLATEAAADVLRQGGHAVDAAIAAHAVLGLVEPQSSGLGGGAFMLVYDRASGNVMAYDGRETAPAGANDEMFLADGEPMGFVDAWQSGRSVGTPGVVALYTFAHQRHGKLDMADNLTPAIRLARDGFEVSPRLAGYLPRMAAISRLDENPATAAYFYPGGEPLAAGARLRNPDYATTLTRFAQEGPAAFYTGSIAEEIVAAAGAEPHAGTLSLEDLAGYQVAERTAICGAVPEGHLCTMPPPSSGLVQIMILNLYDTLAPTVAEGFDLRRFVDAQRLAYADRDHYVADADFVQVPAEGLIDPEYLAVRAGEAFAPDAIPQPGDPGDVLDGTPIIDLWGRDTTREPAGTTHLSIVDVHGNAVSMTATVEAPFGSSRWAGGFLLNNEMTDFARVPTKGGKPVANRVEPGKRPRSSMSPVILLDEGGALRLVTGSPGGNQIIAYVAKSLIGILRAGMSPEAAVAAPNVIARGPKVRVETGVPGGPEQAALLDDAGYPVDEREGENSGLSVIFVHEDRLEGAADPRREGTVAILPPAA